MYKIPTCGSSTEPCGTPQVWWRFKLTPPVLNSLNYLYIHICINCIILIQTTFYFVTLILIKYKTLNRWSVTLQTWWPGVCSSAFILKVPAGVTLFSVCELTAGRRRRDSRNESSGGDRQTVRGHLIWSQTSCSKHLHSGSVNAPPGLSLRVSVFFCRSEVWMMPDQISVCEFLSETTEDYNSPTTSSFTTRLQSCRNTVSILEEVAASASACLPACLSACLSVCLPACLPVCLPVCLSACLPVCLPDCLPACLSVSDLNLTSVPVSACAAPSCLEDGEHN